MTRGSRSGPLHYARAAEGRRERVPAHAPKYRSLVPTPGAAAELLASSAGKDDVHATLAHTGTAFGWTGAGKTLLVGYYGSGQTGQGFYIDDGAPMRKPIRAR